MDRRGFLRSTALLPAAGALGCATAASTGCTASDVFGSENTVRVAVTWSAFELIAFRKVLERLPKRSKKVDPYRVEPLPLGDDIEAALNTKGARGPDIVMLPQPGLSRRHREKLHQIPTGVWDPGSPSQPYAEFWKKLLVDDGKAYGLPFKGAVKSLVWYRKSEFRDQNAFRNLANWRGLALGGGDGWMLTDFFENVLFSLDASAYRGLLRTPDEEVRDWTRPAIQNAFETLTRIWGRPGALAGGVDRALATQFPDAVRDVFQSRRASMVVAPDFAEVYVRQALETESLDTEIGVTRFPRLGDQGVGEEPRIAAGDIAVLPREPSEQVEDLLRRLAHREAPWAWIDETGGFTPVHMRTPLSPNTVSGLSALTEELRYARDEFEFDLSDEIGPIGGRTALWDVLRILLEGIRDRTGSPETLAENAVRHLQRLEDELPRKRPG